MLAHKKLIFLLLSLFILLNKNDIISQSKALSLEDCISLALKHNFDLKIQQQAIKQARAKSRQLKSSRLPTFDFEASYIRFSEVMETDLSKRMTDFPFQIPPTTLRFGDEDNYAFKITMAQPLFTGFKLTNNIKASENQLQAAYFDEKVQINDLIFNVKQTYHNLLNVRQSKSATEISLQLVEAHLNDLQNMFDQGMVAKNEILKVEIKKSEIELMINQIENNIALLKKSFLNLLGLDLNTDIKLEQELTYDQFPIILSQAFESAYANRPELIQIDYHIKALEHLTNASKGEYFPMLSLIGSYEYGKPGLNKLENEWMDYWTVGIAAQWNIWDWGNKHAKVEQAKAYLKQVLETRKKIQQSIQLDVHQALLKKQEAEQRVDVAKKIKLQAEENFRLVSDRFHQGLETNTEFLDAESQLTKAKISEARAIADYNIAVANLERAMGNFVSEASK